MAAAPAPPQVNNGGSAGNTVPAANINPADAPEVQTAGTLTDAVLNYCPGKGFFQKYGMTDVQVAKQASGQTRDNLVLGSWRWY